MKASGFACKFVEIKFSISMLFQKFVAPNKTKPNIIYAKQKNKNKRGPN